MKKDMLSITDLVTRLYTEKPYLRDDSRALLAHVWLDRLKSLEFDTKEQSGLDLLIHIAKNTNMPKHESVSRCGRKIQQHRPELRGKKWLNRQMLKTNAKNELNEIENKITKI